MASLTIAGSSYDLAGLRVADMRSLSKSGALKRLETLLDLEFWAQAETAAEVVSASVRRAGGGLTSEALLELTPAQELPAIILAVTEVMKLSGFDQVAGGPSPNAEGPTSTSVE